MSTPSTFTMPAVALMTPVLVSPDPDFTGPITAFVTRVGTDTVDCLAISQSGVIRFRSCWHKDDPKIATRKELIREDETRGVWDLTEGEKSIRELYRLFHKINERLEKQETMITDLAMRVARAKKD